MANIRVHELAKEMNRSNREVFDRLRRLGIPAKTNLSSVEFKDANKVRVSFGEKPVKPPKKPAAKKPAKKPAAKKPAAKKPAAKPAAKKPAVKKPETKPAAKEPVEARAAAPAAVLEKPAAAPAKPAARPPAKAVKAPTPAEAARAKAGKAPVRPATGPAAIQPTKAEKGKAQKGPIKAVKPPPLPPVSRKKGKKPLLKVAPAEQRETVRPPEKKVYRFVPKGRGAPHRVKGPPSTVAPKFVRVSSGMTVKDFAQKIGLKPTDIIKKMMAFGDMITLNQVITDDAMRLLAEDLGIELKIKAARVDELEGIEEIEDRPEDLAGKPPVVTVMGHVDHGKTMLLDTIRKTDVISQETGGITQHIGAYQVVFHGKPITFIDTPGHESFTAMRARGAQLTDIVILLIAADDGVMPQTLEALDHAKESGVPIIVAVNKIDKPDADAHRVRQQISEKGLIPDDWGGETVFVDISAKEGTNIEHLLEMILLVSEMQELKANPRAEASGVTVEAKLDKTRGPVATVLIQRGTARIGDVVVVGTAWGKIRAMFNSWGDAVESAGPSAPVEILGLSSLPMAGDEFRVVEDEKKARQVTDRRRMLKKLDEQEGPRHVSLENLLDRIREGEVEDLKVVLKADTQGSLEALLESLAKLPQEEVKLKVIHSGVGGITETDIMLASASDAIVLGFHVRPDGNAARAAEAEEVEIRTYQVIYKLTEDMEAALKGMLAPVFEEEITGRVEVRQVFRVTGFGMVAGSYVLEGEVTRGSLVRVIRDGVVVHEGKIATLRRFKDDVRFVSAGFECGVTLENFQDVKEGDVLEIYVMKEVPR